jgi:hypothetical protein
MTRHVIDLREPPKDLPPIDFKLSDSDRLAVEFANVDIALHVMLQNEKDAKKQG